MQKIDLKYIKGLEQRNYEYLVSNEKYIVKKEFVDESGEVFEKGLVFRYLTYTFVPYYDGLQWWITTDDEDVNSIRLYLGNENFLFISNNIELYFDIFK